MKKQARINGKLSSAYILFKDGTEIYGFRVWGKLYWSGDLVKG